MKRMSMQAKQGFRGTTIVANLSTTQILSWGATKQPQQIFPQNDPKALLAFLCVTSHPHPPTTSASMDTFVAYLAKYQR
jgi:hypothetical protein